MCVAICCNMLQYVAVCCRVLQCAVQCCIVCCNVLQCIWSSSVCSFIATRSRIQVCGCTWMYVCMCFWLCVCAGKTSNLLRVQYGVWVLHAHFGRTCISHICIGVCVCTSLICMCVHIYIQTTKRWKNHEYSAMCGCPVRTISKRVYHTLYRACMYLNFCHGMHACTYIISDKRNGGKITSTAQCMDGSCALLGHGALAMRSFAIRVVGMCVCVSKYTCVCIYTRVGVCVCVYVYVEM